jgi:nucleoside 2-deoxyribosyltransferase
MNKDSKVYLSGPITGVVDYKERFKETQRELWNMGCGFVMNPAEVMNHTPVDKMSRSEIMTICYALMQACDTIYLMDGWRTSQGCREELAWAKAHGMEVVE